MINKKITKKINDLIAKVALAATVSNVNTTCDYWAYQAKLPESAKKLRKF